MMSSRRECERPTAVGTFSHQNRGFSASSLEVCPSGAPVRSALWMTLNRNLIKSRILPELSWWEATFSPRTFRENVLPLMQPPISRYVSLNGAGVSSGCDLLPRMTNELHHPTPPQTAQSALLAVMNSTSWIQRWNTHTLPVARRKGWALDLISLFLPPENSL